MYAAHDEKLGRKVALKLLPRSLMDDPERRVRFEREARTVAALNHPGNRHRLLGRRSGRRAVSYHGARGGTASLRVYPGERTAARSSPRFRDPAGGSGSEESLRIWRQTGIAATAVLWRRRALVMANVTPRTKGGTYLDMGCSSGTYDVNDGLKEN